MNFALILLVGLLFKASSAIDTVKELNLNAFVGHWYEVASSASVRDKMEKDGFCQNAIYKMRDDGSIDVLNMQRKGSVTGEFSSIAGTATQPDTSIPGKLIIDFGGYKKGDYWVYAVGPIVDGLYDWSLVSDSKQLYMWVQARDPQVYIQKYEATVKPMVTNELGFDQEQNQYIERSHFGCLAYDL